jgi:SNF2 family DNA or RNA helicase
MPSTILPKKSEANTTELLFAIYKNEPLLHKRILQIKALLFFMPTKSEFLNGISRTILRAEDGKKLTHPNLNLILENLQKKKLLTRDFNCNPAILHKIAEDAVGPHNTEAELNLSTLTHFFNYQIDYQFDNNSSLSNIRIIHIAAQLNNPHIFLNASLAMPYHYSAFANDLTKIFYPYHIDHDWVNSRHPAIQLHLLCIKLHGFHGNVNELPPDFEQWLHFFFKNDWIDMAIKNNLDKIPIIMSRLLQLSLAFKHISYLDQSISPLSQDQYFYWEAQGTLEFFNENKAGAIQYYEKANKLFKSILDKHQWFTANLNGIFYVLALLYHNASTEELKKASSAITSLKKIQVHEAIPNILTAILYLKTNDRVNAIFYYNYAKRSIEYSPCILPIVNALIDWTEALLEPEQLPQLTPKYQGKFRHYRDSSQNFIAQIYAELIELQNEHDEETQHFFKSLSPFGNFRFMNILRVKQPWEYAIDQLHNILTDGPSTNQPAVADRRMIWLIDPPSLQIDVAEQVLRKNGTWSAGRPIALKRLYSIDPNLDYLTSLDHAAISGLSRETYGWYNHEQFSWDAKQTLTALIGHPFVFHSQNRDIPMELIKGSVELQVEKINSGYHFSLSKFSTTSRVFLEKETTNRYRVIDLSDEMVSICKILTEKGMTVPFQAKDRVISMICNAKSSIHIQSDVADEDLPTLPGNTTPCVHLFPIQDGLKVNVWIKPLGEKGSYYRASHGQKSVITTITTAQGEERKKLIRDFGKEKSGVDSLINQCATLAEFNEMTDEWYVPTLEDSLELMFELEEYKKNNPLTIEWPKGQTLKVKNTVSSKSLSLSIKGSGYWFEYDGEVNVDDEQALDIKKLLDLLGESQGRFIPFASGEFIALTEKFRKQLEDLKALSDGNKIYHLSSSSLRALAEEAGSLKKDQEWTTHIKKLTAMEKHQPILPSTLQAELRDYQKEGFSYLSRLAHWEIGACLADDMGLGKTIQAIALLLSHAQKGPCLVIAPTSVCFVWLEELAKFAPTLVPHTLYNANDRKTLIDSLGKMDILICSYGLLHQSGELLLKKSWKMLILDEAQAIKNPDTKRWKYATQLNSKCRIALTGTPIENHLGELWSIFRFLNPGLLGSLAFFQQRFSGPIEKYNDPIAKRALKSLVSPYILRRTKTEVLLELPPKIEQSILIEPSAEESAFYEAVRVKALERISEINKSEDKNTKRFSILAEISRLRQACCHASLVDENITIASSKIQSFLTLTKNLIDNKHKVLIFSQFVRYLEKIKEVLDQEKIHYQYLDGGTSIKDRQRAVNDFQSGIGDLFLISLKAGGTGLNLTAADYVIILDPWWNPAVEDQAADRAHRMGQLRPVTVYRLIMKNTIEEKILTLHKNKKDLAADLLSGSDMAGKISEDELVGLITG